MKKSIIFFVILGYNMLLLSQKEITCEGKIYETPCHARVFIVTKDSLQSVNNYKASIGENLKILEISPDKALYRLAISYSNLDNRDSAFYYLNKFIDCSKDDRLIILDKNFDNLRKDSVRWKQITNKIENLYLAELKNVNNKELALQLFYLGIEDQKYRLFLPAMKQIETDSNGRFSIRVDNTMDTKLKEIVKKHGMPGISDVGLLGSKNIFLLIQHSFKIKRAYYKAIEKLYKKNDFPPLDFALLKDAYLSDRNRKQIYGTQLVSAFKKWKKTYDGKMILYPVKDFKNVNQRRKEIGFQSTVEEYVESWNNPRYVIPREYYY